jgi:hypothetical protein
MTSEEATEDPSESEHTTPLQRRLMARPSQQTEPLLPQSGSTQHLSRAPTLPEIVLTSPITLDDTTDHGDMSRRVDHQWPLATALTSPLLPFRRESLVRQRQHVSDSQDGLEQDLLPLEIQNDTKDDVGSQHLSMAKLIGIEIGLMMAMFVVGLDSTVLGPAIPEITREFESLLDISWCETQDPSIR